MTAANPNHCYRQPRPAAYTMSVPKTFLVCICCGKFYLSAAHLLLYCFIRRYRKSVNSGFCCYSNCGFQRDLHNRNPAGILPEGLHLLPLPVCNQRYAGSYLRLKWQRFLYLLVPAAAVRICGTDTWACYPPSFPQNKPLCGKTHGRHRIYVGSCKYNNLFAVHKKDEV